MDGRLVYADGTPTQHAEEFGCLGAAVLAVCYSRLRGMGRMVIDASAVPRIGLMHINGLAEGACLGMTF